MAEKQCLSVTRIDNGFLIYYVTGTRTTRNLMGESETLELGVRHAPTAHDAAGLIEHLLGKVAGLTPAEANRLREEDD